MNVCRICLCDESEAFDRFLVDIFQQSNDNHKFSVPAALQSICGIELSESATGPNQVCIECRSRLEEAFNLRRLALRSHETLAARSSNLAPKVPKETSTDVQWMEVEPLQNNADDATSDNLSYTEDLVEENTVEASPGDLLICCGCDFTFTDEWSLMEHSREVHYPGVPFNPPRSKVLCRICYALFVSEKILAVHWSGKTGGRVVRICPRCGDRFWRKESYEGHVCSGQEEELFRCCGCDFQTVEESKFKRHARCHRNAEWKTRDEKLVKLRTIFCSVCAGRFETREELAKHRAGTLCLYGTSMVKVGDLVDLKLTCCGCLKVYKTVEEVKEHQQLFHAPEREAVSADVYECGDCYKRFLCKSQLKKHTNTRRNYTCSKCPAMRHSVQNMLQHLASHDGPKSYWCCGCRLHRERFDMWNRESATGPNQVCIECRSRLEEAFNLRRLALRSHETLAARSSNLAPKVPKETSTDVQWMEVEPLQNNADDATSDNLSYTEDLVEENTVEASPGDLLICCGCDFTFTDEWSLMEHSREVHYPGVPFNPPRSKVLCRICYALFVSEKILAVHWSGKTGGRVVRICPRCGDRFWRKESYEGHVCSGQEEELFRCCGCDFQTVEESKFKRHARCHRNAEWKTRDEKLVKLRTIFCSVCAGRFETREELAKHRAGTLCLYGTSMVKVGDLVDLKLTCCGCLKVYKTVEEVKEHQQLFHAPEREAVSADVYECGDCYKRFLCKSQLKKHTNTRRNYTCSKCPAMRHSVQNMLQHLASHDGPKSYWCCGCRLHRERFDTPEELARHSQEIHATQPQFYRNVDHVEEELPFQCKTCFRRYSSEKRLRAHMVVTYEEESFVCDTCGKPFSRVAAFETHMATHRETSDYPCPICSKKFKHHKLARICELRHLKAATEYDCKICGGKFSTSSNLNSHLISHTEATRFSCSICGMRFKRKTGLRAHMLLHGSERKFACPYCPSRFHTAKTLDKHMIHHTGIYPYDCEFPGCGKKFQARLKYIEHFETHQDDAARVFSCHMCEQRYSRDHFLANHLKYAHRIEPQDRGWRGKFNRQRQPWVRPAERPAALAGEVEDGYDNDEELNEAVEYIEQDIE